MGQDSGRTADWTRENYETSLTSRCWSATPCGAGWDGSAELGESVPASAEMRGIFGEEMALGEVPAWAREILERMVDELPYCGHYTFPRPVLDICRAVRDRACPEVVIGHYTADPERKRLMAYYVLCLDAWSAEVAVEAAVAELAMRDSLGQDWAAIAEAIYRSLGQHTERKDLLVRRMVQRQRWWLKTLIWPGDRRDQFGLDAYLGDVRGDVANYGCYGNPPFGDPYFAELKLPQVREWSDAIRANGDGELLGQIEHSHLCAPKAFRHLERRILAIGAVDGAPADADASILRCEATYPDFGAYRDWYARFVGSLGRWLEGDASAVPELGSPDLVSHWIVRILRHKLRLYEREDTPFGRLVGAYPAGRSGAGRIQ